MHKVGDRIGALLSVSETEVKVLGFGIYAGEEVPTRAVGMLAEILRTTKFPNPKLVLDSGKVVYGCECWWGPQDTVKARIAEREARGDTIEYVDIDEVRDEYLKRADKWDAAPERDQ